MYIWWVAGVRGDTMFYCVFVQPYVYLWELSIAECTYITLAYVLNYRSAIIDVCLLS